jgi:MOSC domain-containing protein YiiM
VPMMTAERCPADAAAGGFHLPREVLEERLRALPAPPRDAGTVALVVARPAVNARLTPERTRLTPEEGVEDDRWGEKLRSNPGNQVTVMRADVARLFANGQPLSLFGDNLLVELDLSLENLPAGTRLRIGSALCEVTPLPHTGCGKFAARFGQDARDVTFLPEWVDHRLRGIHVRVLEAGEVSPGDPVEVLSRADASAPIQQAAP